MCLIIAGKLPRLNVLELAEKANPHGGGIAWRSRSGLLHYRKGLNAAEIDSFPKSVKAKCIAHFRTATAGGTGQLMTHPFPADKDATLALSGATSEPLVFHNGHWSDWKETLLSFIVPRNVPMPDGAWSDSRAIAFLIAHLGTGFAYLLPSTERIAILTAKETVLHGIWSEEDGANYSNRYWEYREKKKSETPNVSQLSTALAMINDSYYRQGDDGELVDYTLRGATDRLNASEKDLEYAKEWAEKREKYAKWAEKRAKREPATEGR